MASWNIGYSFEEFAGDIEQGRLNGHGKVGRCFDGAAQAVFM